MLGYHMLFIEKRTLDEKFIVRATVSQELPVALLVIQKAMEIGKQDLNLTSSWSTGQRKTKEGRTRSVTEENKKELFMPSKGLLGVPARKSEIL